MQKITDVIPSLKSKFELSLNKFTVVEGTEKNLRILYALYALENPGCKVFFVCRNDFDAQRYYDELKRYMEEDDLLIYPCEPFYFTHPDSYSTEITVKRLKALARLNSEKSAIIVTSAWALCETFPDSDFFNSVSYRVGDTLSPEDMVEKLINLGYCREEQTHARGQFSVRGGIVDFFSADNDNPIRVEFFADEIDSVREFSADNMLTLNNVESFSLSPFSQYILDEKELMLAYSQMCSLRAERLAHISDPDLHQMAEAESSELLERISTDLSESSKLLYPFSGVKRKSLLDFAHESFVMLCDLDVLRSGIKEVSSRIHDDYLMLAEKALAFAPQLKMFNSFEDVLKKVFEGGGIIFPSLQKDIDKTGISVEKSIYAAGADLLNYKGNIRLLLSSVESYKQNGYTILVACKDETETESISSLFETYGIKHSLTFIRGGVCVMQGLDCPGIDFPSEKIVVIPFGYVIPGGKTKAVKKPVDISKEFFSDIRYGDYVVHETHGIGIYEGITRMETDGVSKDYVKIGYANEDKLYVPPEQLDLIQKYVGAGDAPPKITRLGSSDWSNAKKKVSKAVKQLAEEYLVMYAKRKDEKGYAFAADNPWQSEFEDSFDFRATEDQIKCTEEIKSDMSKPEPMDRLLLGDVGYGKTEVAMRAAFKAVMEPKQVAVLVPTTILALQHYNNFTERFKNYPVKIELMCRFRTPAQLKKTAQRVKEGEVDILIGTHRILSKDVEFRDLGLLIVDEEQRFGVAHKEKLKLLKSNVDTLTLSATPIPRTLHMSLSGIRDMSVINTPPCERLEVQTYVMPGDDTVIKSAVVNEMSRGGQVFYLYNKVDTIAERAFKIKALVPDARVAYAHGQMNERQLEQVMLDFLNYEYDVLVCTTIIENGVDITNANTIIIENADCLGLSQLYQLRGRVGRGSVRAYAYMLYNSHKEMNEAAMKRLRTIKEFTKFGSGFKIAMRDLQIRGAGNIMGANQHGHFANVGYEMYCRLLHEAVTESMGQVSKQKRISEVDINVDAYIPHEYISDEEERIKVYKDIALIDSDEDLSRVADELTDIYSDMPAVVYKLLRVARLKALCAECGIKKLRQTASSFVLEFFDGIFFDAEFINGLDGKYKIKFKNSGTSGILSALIPKNKDVLDFAYDFVGNFVAN